MTSNVYTKNEILQNLASKGYFVDAYTLDTFFEKWKIEAIFEDEQGSEFYDKNALDLILNNMFAPSSNYQKEQEQKEEIVSIRTLEAPKEPYSAPVDNSVVDVTQSQAVQTIQQIEPQPSEIIPQPVYEQPYSQPPVQNNPSVYPQNIPLDSDVNNILNNIALSDGTPLIDKVQEPSGDFMKIDLVNEPEMNIQTPSEEPFDFGIQKEKKIGILEGAMLASGQEYIQEPSIPELPASSDIAQVEDDSDFDDISLLSESYEAQEKFREYVVSELSKKNVDLTPKTNEFKLDISERTLNMIARTMAKKIAKHVSQICCADAKSSAKLEEIEEKNKKLEQRARELEEQNKKLRLLLVESNKNLNSYKPSILGLYKKVPSGK